MGYLFLGQIRVMPPTHYKVFQWGGPAAATATAPSHVYVAGVAKAATAGDPWAVVNEVVCGHLGRVLGLPIPPGFIVMNGATPYHASMNFDLAGQGLPPVIPADFVARQPELSWGIVLFDVMVANVDRHDRNLAMDTGSGQVRIFDHSHAFWRGPNGVANLMQSGGQLSIGGHCLLAHLANSSGFEKWMKRIEQLPDFVIEDALDAAVEVGLPVADRDTSAGFLFARRDGLRALVKQHESAFPAAVRPLL